MWPLNSKTKNQEKNKSKRKAAAGKRGAKQAQSLMRRRRISQFFRIASLTAVSMAAIMSIYIWKSGLLHQWTMEAGDRVDRQIADAGFKVEEVRITGQGNTSLQQVRAALGLYDGQSIVSLDLGRMLDQVSALPWVKRATITRILPDALDVIILEHQAAAIWQQNDQLFLVDQAGHIITQEGLDNFDQLPHVVGSGANENLLGLMAMKDYYPDLFARVKSAVWVGQRRWDVNFHNGIKIKLPEKGVMLAWQKLHDYEKRQKILGKQIVSVDLRLPGKTILRLTPKEAERRRLLNKTGIKEESI